MKGHKATIYFRRKPIQSIQVIQVAYILADKTYVSLLENAEKAALPGQQAQLDQMQGDALHKALSQSFCVVQGVAGSGKTLIAKACAGEAGVPFLYACGSDFNGM